MKQILRTGVIRSPHGIKGYVKASPTAEDFSHFFKLREVILSKNDKNKTLEIEDLKSFGNELLIKFKGIDTPEDAKMISGWDILVPRENASRLEKGKVYVADLVGMKLVYDKEEIGTVVSTFEGAQALLMEVKCSDGKLRLVPFLRGVFVDDVDVENNTMKLLKKELCCEY